MKASWDKTTGTGFSNAAEAAKISIAYDATTGGYTISTGSYSQAFLPADVTSHDDYDTVYSKDGAILTLMSKGYDTNITTKYVAMGLLQRNSNSGSTQNTELTSFTYGLPTSASATPRTGTASFARQAFGAVSAPGEEPLSFQGSGQFDIDFAQRIFSGHSYLSEHGLVKGGGAIGGGIELTTVGTLSSTDAGLSGTAIYQGQYGAVAAKLSGSLYGPSGQELGASFSGDNTDGVSVTGSIVGQQSASLTPDNLSFLDMTQQQLFYTQFGNNLVGQLNWLNSETFTYGAPISDESGGKFTVNDKVSGAKNFTTYHKSLPNSYYGTQDVTLELYKPGPSNSELALTYASFGHWSGTVPVYGGTSLADEWFAYGFESPSYAMAARTGSASYKGIAHGTGTAGNLRYDVSGTSSLTVNFSADTFTGALTLAGRDTSSNTQVNFGTSAFAGSIDTRSNTLQGSFGTADSPYGTLTSRFYGPDGREIAGTFGFTVQPGAAGAGTNILGALAAVQK